MAFIRMLLMRRPQRDARAAYGVAREQLGIDAKRIAYFGHSLGSAVATELGYDYLPVAEALS